MANNKICFSWPEYDAYTLETSQKIFADMTFPKLRSFELYSILTLLNPEDVLNFLAVCFIFATIVLLKWRFRDILVIITDLVFLVYILKKIIINFKM